MSDSSSRESSPRRFRPASPGSDDGNPAPGTSLSSSFYSTPFSSNFASSATPILRQPVGFSWNVPASTLNTYSASLPAAPVTQFLPGQELPTAKPAKKKSAKSKDKEAPKAKAKATSSRKPKVQNSAGKAPRAKAGVPTPVLAAASTPIDFSGVTGHTTAFRVRSYVNDPAAGGSVIPPGKGPYNSDYRAESTATHNSVARHPPGPSSARQTHYRPQSHTPAKPPPAPPIATPQPQKRSYYRNDYEKQRDGAPARRARATAPVDPVPKTTPNPTAHTPHQPIPAPMSMSDFPMGDQPDDYFDPFASMQPAPLPTPVQYDLPEPHRRHSRSHSHRSHRSSATPAVQNLPSASAPPPAGYAGGPTPAPAVRYLRTLTLLIDDLRNGESQLAEVRVPLKAPDNPEDGFWADAKEVCSELQASPSRIDGRAKVYAMRGKFKQYFMRVSSEGDIESMSANLKVSKERTLEVFVEDNPLPGGAVTSAPTFPSTLALFTPDDSDPIHSPSPAALVAPRPMVPFPALADDFGTSFGNFEQNTAPPNPRKRRHSGSSRRSPSSVSEGSAMQSHAEQQQSEHSSPAEEEQEGEAGDGTAEETSPTSQTSPLAYSSAQVSYAPEHSMPSSRNSTPAYPQPSYAPALEELSHPLGDPSFLPGPSQPKRARHAVPTESSERGQSWNAGMLSSVQPSPGMAAVSPFHRSGNGFSLPTPQSDTSATPLSHASPALPSSAAPPVASQAEVDTAVGKYLRSIVSQEAAWDTFVERRNAVLPMASQLEQYQYIKGMFSRFTSLRTPPDLKGAPGVIITQAHVLRAFNLPVTWGDECKEVLALTGMYGRAGRRYEDPRVVAMLDEAPPISTGMQVKRYLTLLREIHGRWTVEHPHE